MVVIRLRRLILTFAVSSLTALPQHGLAADLGDVRLSRTGAKVTLDLQLSGPTAQPPTEISFTEDRRTAFIRIVDIDRMPALPILDADSAGLAFAMIERRAAREARITLIANEQMQVVEAAAKPPDGHVWIEFRMGRIERRPVKPQVPPKLSAPPRFDTVLRLPKEIVPLALVPKAAGPIGKVPPQNTPPESAAPIGAVPPVPAGLAVEKMVIASAQAGSVEAMVDIGNLILANPSINQTAARQWFQAAADRGSAVAAYNLGQLYRRGIGGPVDDAAAARAYGLAAKAGFGAAEYNLALLLLEGRGGAQDPERARSLLELAVSHGYARATDVLRDLGKPPAPQPAKPPK
jgi:D-serine deaminase-like pyridoxal phosphate-dependent protein